MDTTAEELLSARAAEEEAEANAFDDELLEALSEGDTGPASPEVSIDGNNGDTPSAKRQKLYSTGTAEQSAGQLPASRGALLPGSLQGSLQVFPSELVFRVLSFLSAEDLTAAAPVCRHFRIAACSNMLWRRLFDARFGSLREETDAAKEWERPLAWKDRYMARDAAELKEVLQSVSDMLKPFYAQMTAAKRSVSLGVMENLHLAEAQSAGQVAAWRKSRGLPMLGPAPADTCKARCCFMQLSNTVYVCERCGLAHFCGEACTERVLDRSCDLPVCPISGCCFSRMVFPWEEGGDMDPRDHKGDEGVTEAADDGMAGRLATAYVDGYNCTSEAELHRLISGHC
ncbi:g10021 [Coccomyxa viridis]|uniref:G10021 protein n=1 Tax=Coccomyxa viridis TaxID=1274662 RepID=A0ABP1G4Q8_9CHLO